MIDYMPYERRANKARSTCNENFHRRTLCISVISPRTRHIFLNSLWPTNIE
jgi:hypothetical protein